jgi:hypothetical protein
MPILDNFRPITRACQILEAPIKDCVRAARETREAIFAQEMRAVGEPEKISTYSLSKTAAGDSLEAGLRFLLPLVAPEPLRYVFLETVPFSWTVFFSNWKSCWGHPELVAGISGRLKTRGIFSMNQEHTRKKNKGYYGSFKFYYYEGSETPSRRIECLNDAGPWFFGQEGDPLPFEDTERYAHRNTRERFTGEMLLSYLQHFGLRPYDDTFYEVDAARPALGLEAVEKDPHLKSLNKFYSLEQVKR